MDQMDWKATLVNMATQVYPVFKVLISITSNFHLIFFSLNCLLWTNVFDHLNQIGPPGLPGIYDPSLDEISVGAQGPQGDVGELGDRGKVPQMNL